MLSFCLVFQAVFSVINCLGEDNVVPETYTIVGKIQVERKFLDGHENWLRKAHIFVNGGSFISIPE